MTLRVQRLYRKLSRRFATWETDSLGVARRHYRNYETYLRHQMAKLRERPETVEHFDRLIAEALPQRISDLDLTTARVVCVAARRGGEVRAFRSLGAFAWGVDIAPGLGNAYVTVGDMHDLCEIAPDSADIIYTNSLDHSYELAEVVRAAGRVLRPGGLFIVELIEGIEPGNFESRRWRSIEEVVSALLRTGPPESSRYESRKTFRLISKKHFDSPWSGVHVRLEKLSMS